MSESESTKIEYPNKSFKLLNSNFWDSFEKISKHHQIECKYIIEEMSKEKENENKENESKILTITESLKTIVQIDLRHHYLFYLKYCFCLCEPLTINQLKTNFKNNVFPYFLFTLLVRKKEIHFLIIDFFEKKIIIMNKEKIVENMPLVKIKSVSKNGNSSIKITLEGKDLGNDYTLEIFPEFFQQINLIYTIIDFFIKYNNNKINEETELKMLDDDTYIPKGILLKTHILKEHQNKLLSKDKRYAVLGSSQIIIFKDNTMKEIRNVIPLLTYSTQLISDDKELIISFKYFYRDQSLTFFDENTYLQWKNTLKDIFNKKITEKIDGITLYQIKEKNINSKILDLLNVEIKEIEEKINKNKEDFENMKKLINNNEN